MRGLGRGDLSFFLRKIFRGDVGWRREGIKNFIVSLMHETMKFFIVLWIFLFIET